MIHPKLDYIELHFDTKGSITFISESVIERCLNSSITDLIVISHGWNNNIEEARDLYDRILNNLNEELTCLFRTQRRFLVVKIFWPSKRFTDSTLIPGGAASVSHHGSSAIDHLNKLFTYTMDSNIQEALQRLISLLQDSERSQEFSVKLFTNLRKLVLLINHNSPITEPEDEILQNLDPIQGELVLRKIISKDRSQPSEHGGAVSQSLTSRIKAAVYARIPSIVNYITYYEMKNRAGIVGANGLAPVIEEIKLKIPDLKIHLIGHSFGARLVTASASLLPLSVSTLSLLQAAFSQYSFARKYDGKRDGVFRKVITMPCVIGPILVTHSRQDSNVGYYYAVASRLKSQVAEAVGDSSDFYGGLGGNGAQKTPEAETVLLGNSYSFKPGKLYNIDGNNYQNGLDYIHDHSDIAKVEIAKAIVQAIATV